MKFSSAMRDKKNLKASRSTFTGRGEYYQLSILVIIYINLCLFQWKLTLYTKKQWTLKKRTENTPKKVSNLTNWCKTNTKFDGRFKTKFYVRFTSFGVQGNAEKRVDYSYERHVKSSTFIWIPLYRLLCFIF